MKMIEASVGWFLLIALRYTLEQAFESAVPGVGNVYKRVDEPFDNGRGRIVASPPLAGQQKCIADTAKWGP